MGYEIIKLLKEFGIIEKPEEEGEGEEEGEPKTLIDYKYRGSIILLYRLLII